MANCFSSRCLQLSGRRRHWETEVMPYQSLTRTWLVCVGERWLCSWVVSINLYLQCHFVSKTDLKILIFFTLLSSCRYGAAEPHSVAAFMGGKKVTAFPKSSQANHPALLHAGVRISSGSITLYCQGRDCKHRLWVSRCDLLGYVEKVDTVRV